MRRNTSLQERKDLEANFSYMHVSSGIIFRSRRIVNETALKLFVCCTYLIHRRRKKIMSKPKSSIIWARTLALIVSDSWALLSSWKNDRLTVKGKHLLAPIALNNSRCVYKFHNIDRLPPFARLKWIKKKFAFIFSKFDKINANQNKT